MKIVVIYDYTIMDESKCLDCIKNYGVHILAYYKATEGKYYWNIAEIRKAING